MSALAVVAGPREGKHVEHNPSCWDASYAEAWAKRHPFGQSRIELARLRAGKAAHRAHRKLLKGRGPK